jgi:hypothetical protein
MVMRRAEFVLSLEQTKDGMMKAPKKNDMEAVLALLTSLDALGGAPLCDRQGTCDRLWAHVAGMLDVLPPEGVPGVNKASHAQYVAAFALLSKNPAHVARQPAAALTDALSMCFGWIVGPEGDDGVLRGPPPAIVAQGAVLRSYAQVLQQLVGGWACDMAVEVEVGDGEANTGPLLNLLYFFGHLAEHEPPGARAPTT